MEGRCHVDTSVEGVATAFRARKEGFWAASETPAKGDPRQAVAVLTSELPDLHPCCGTSLSLSVSNIKTPGLGVQLMWVLIPAPLSPAVHPQPSCLLPLSELLGSSSLMWKWDNLEAGLT